MAEELDKSLPNVTKIISSPLSRCRLLAEAIGKKKQIAVNEDEDLIEMNFGAWENKLWDTIERAELDAWADDFFDARPHGGESVAMLQTRVRSAVARLDQEPTLWVSHAGVYRALLAQTDHPDPWNAQIGFAEFRIIDLP